MIAKMKAPDLSEVVFISYSIAFFYTVLHALYRIFFGENVNREQALFACSIVITWSLFSVVIQIMAYSTRFFHRRAQLKIEQRCRHFMLIGFGGCFVISFLPRISVFFDKSDFLWYVIYSSIGGISFFYTLNLSFLNTLVDIKRSWNKTTWLILVAHLALLLASVVFGFYYKNGADSTEVLLCQLFFSLGSVMAHVDLYNVWNGNFSVSEILKTADPEALKLLDLPMKKNPRFDCNICMQKYNKTNRALRILDDCGHTVCKECEDELMKKLEDWDCPFCQVATLWKGPASSLPKNFALLDSNDSKKNQHSIENIV